MRASASLLTSAFCLSALFGCAVEPTASTSEPQPREHVLHHDVPWVDSHAIRPAATGNLTYYGGRVVSDLHVVQVIWGGGSYLSNVTSTATPSMATFYQQALNSSYVAWLDHDYNTVSPSPASGSTKTDQHIGPGSFVGQYTITPSVTGTVDDSQIQSEIASQIAAGHLPAPTTDAAGNNNTYYAIFFPHGTTITMGGSSSCVSGGFCAYHGTISNVGGHEVYYGVHPDMQPGSGCDTGCGSSSAFGNYTSVASHEMVETITDAEVGLATSNGPPLAWYDTSNGEIGDICNADQGTFVGSDGVTYTIQNEWSNSQGNCISQIAGISFGNDFSISASPASGTVTAGGSTSATIATSTTSGSAETVSLSVSGAPTGVTASVSPTSVTSGDSATLSVTTTAAAAAGTYTLTVTGTGSSGTHTTTYALTVAGAAGDDFSITASPTSVSMSPGSSGTSTITTAITSGSAESVALSLSGAPSGVTGSFSPASITGAGSATLAIDATAAVAPGTYALTVTGTASSGSHSAIINLTIEGASSDGIANGGFETGDFTGWTTAGTTTVVASGAHGGTFAAQVGGTSPTSGDSSVAQTFTVPAGATSLGFYYQVHCPDTVTYDWATATLTTGATTTTILAKDCSNTGAWKRVTVPVTAGATYTLTLISHDDDYAGDPTYTLFDDVTLDSAVADFTLAASPASMSVGQGSSGAATISTTVASGAAGPVSLVASGAPSGVTVSLSPTSVTAGGSSTLAITVGPTAAIGTSTITVTGTEGSQTHSTTVTLAVTAPSSGGITNGGFETGTLAGWTSSGASTTVVDTGCHGGAYCAQAGASVPTNGNSSITQTFTVPAGKTKVSIWYANTCPDTVTYDWVTITLRDVAAHTTKTLLARTCDPTGTWKHVTGNVTAGRSYTLTLTNRDDDYAGDPTFTRFDDVTLQ